jgi:hypothetical protein
MRVGNLDANRLYLKRHRANEQEAVPQVPEI